MQDFAPNPSHTSTQPATLREFLTFRLGHEDYAIDILTVQEVDGPEALECVVDRDVYGIHVDERPKPPMMNGRQNTGFAFKKGLSVEIRPSVTASTSRTVTCAMAPGSMSPARPDPPLPCRAPEERLLRPGA